MESDNDSRLSSPLSSVPDSPLSWLSRSPSPPGDIAPLSYLGPRKNPYMSPPASQQTSQTASPAPDGMDSSTTADRDGPPPAKRRRTSKDRTTEYLDLRAGSIEPDQQPQLDRLLQVLHKHQKIVVVAGAGISVSAGIPDFRSSSGLFRTLKDDYKLKGSGKDLFDASVYKDDASTSSFHNMVTKMSHMTKDAKPTAFHHMLATIAQEDRLLRLYSQNVDGIDTSLAPLKTCIPFRKEQDGKWPRTVQLHGGLTKMVCSKCHDLSDLDASLFDGPVPPLCPRCEEVDDIRTNHEGKRSHGIGRLRPRMVLYNEHNPDDEAIGAVTRDDLRRRPDAIIVVGTTLRVPGVRRIVREMCGVIRGRRGGTAIWINNDLPPPSKDIEDCWDIVVQGPCDAVATHAAMRQWDEPADDYTEVSEETAARAEQNRMVVQVPQQQREPWPELPTSYARVEELPSLQHLNNSFRPPSPQQGPAVPMDYGPSDWSPLCNRQYSVVSSIESAAASSNAIALDHSDGSSIDAHLLTPTKSQRNSPTKRPLITLNDRLKDASDKKAKLQLNHNKGPKTNLPAKKKKQSNVKYIAPAKSQASQPKVGPPKGAKSKVGPKSAPKPRSTALTKTFKLSKGATLQEQKTKTLLPPSPALSPRKFRQVSSVSASAEPMHPLSPQDPRNNTSVQMATALDMKQAAYSSADLEENQVQATKEGRMRVHNLIN